jgi:hypothetical protein
MTLPSVSKKLVCVILLAIASGLALASCGAGAKDIPLDDRSNRSKLDPADLRYLLQVLRKQLPRCWNWPAPVSGADADVPSATVRFKLKQDGSLVSVQPTPPAPVRESVRACAH